VHAVVFLERGLARVLVGAAGLVFGVGDLRGH
jgi:hypothetical protein